MFAIGMMVGATLILAGMVLGTLITEKRIREQVMEELSEQDFPKTLDGRFYSTDLAIKLASTKNKEE